MKLHKTEIVGFVILLSVLQATSRQTCSPDKYYDPGVEDCQSCVDICPSLEDRCKRLCPEFNKATKAPACSYDTYWDPKVEACQQCEDICLSGQSADDICRRLCPEFNKPTEAPTCSNMTFWESKTGACQDCKDVCPSSDRCARLCPDYLDKDESTFTTGAWIAAASVICLSTALALVALILYILSRCGYDINIFNKQCCAQVERTNDDQPTTPIQEATPLEDVVTKHQIEKVEDNGGFYVI